MIPQQKLNELREGLKEMVGTLCRTGDWIDAGISPPEIDQPRLISEWLSEARKARKGGE